MLNSENIQTAAFFALVLVFEILERVRPEREVDRWKDLKIDVFSFARAITMNRISHYSVTGFVNACAPAWMLGGWHALQGLSGAARIVLAIFLESDDSCEHVSHGLFACNRWIAPYGRRQSGRRAARRWIVCSSSRRWRLQL